MKTAWSVLLVTLAICLMMVWFAFLGFFGTSLQYTSYKFWKPKYENVERETFKNTNSYVEGATSDLMKYKEQYDKAETSQDKEAIREYVLMGYKNFDPNKIENPILRSFLINMQN